MRRRRSAGRCSGRRGFRRMRQESAKEAQDRMYYKNTKDDVVSGLPLAINIFIKLREEILQGILKN